MAALRPKAGLSAGGRGTDRSAGTPVAGKATVRFVLRRRSDNIYLRITTRATAPLGMKAGGA